MAGSASQLFVRTDGGQVYGPIGSDKIDFLFKKGMLQGKVEVSLDGVSYKAPAELPEARELIPKELLSGAAPVANEPPKPLVTAPVVPPPAGAGAPVAGPGALKAAQEAAQKTATAGPKPVRTHLAPTGSPPHTATAPSAAPASSSPASAPAADKPKPPGPPGSNAGPPPTGPAPGSAAPATPAGPQSHGVPVPPIAAQGDLTATSALRLFAQAIAGGTTGRFTLRLPDRCLQIYFRKGNPEGVESDHPEDALGAYLTAQNLVAPAQLAQAEAQKSKFGNDLLGALIGTGLINPANVFQPLASRSLQLLAKAAAASTGTYQFEATELPPGKGLPLGNRWTILTDLARKMPVADVRKRLADQLDLPVIKGNGWVNLEDLRLTAQETRSLSHFDGVRSLNELQKAVPAEADALIRLAFVLREMEAVTFVALQNRPRPAPAPAPPAASPPQPAAPKAATPAPNPSPAPTPAAAAKPAPGMPLPNSVAAAKPAPGMPSTPIAAAAPASKPAAKPPSSPPAWMSAAKGNEARPAATPPPAAAPAAPSAPPDYDRELADLKQRVAALKKQTHFDVLGINDKADGSAVKIAYFKMAKLFHPDTVPPGAPAEFPKLKAEIFSAVGEAYRVLSDDKARANYLDELKHGTGDKVDVAQLLMAEEQFQKATILVKAHKFAEGVAMLDAAIKANAEEAEFYAWRGYARFFANKDRKVSQPEAMKDLQHALKKNEKCAPAHYFLGQILKLTGDNNEAIKHFKRTVELVPTHVDAQRELRLLTGKK